MAVLVAAFAVLFLAVVPQAGAQQEPGQGPDDDYSDIVTTTTSTSTTTTTTAPTTTTTAPTTTTIGAVSPSSAVPPAVAGQPLARTGVSTVPAVGIALLLVAAGLLIVKTQTQTQRR